MTLDEARVAIKAMTYKPGWTLRLADRPDGPTLVITRPDGDAEYAPLSVWLTPMTERDLAFWVHSHLVGLEVRGTRAAFRAGGQSLDELEGA